MRVAPDAGSRWPPALYQPYNGAQSSAGAAAARSPRRRRPCSRQPLARTGHWVGDRMIVDADAPVAECVELFEEYLDPAYADRRPKLIPMRKFRGWWDFDGLILPRQSGKGRGPQAGFAVGAECNDVASRRAFMAEERIDLMVLYPTTLIAACSFTDHDYACALARAYNDWLADYCRACGPDVKGVAIVALQ